MENNKKSEMQKKMMDMCNNMSMDQCQSMMSKMMNKTSDFGGIQADQNTKITGTPELQSLFFEWCGQIRSEILDFVSKSGKSDLKEISEHFKLSTESCDYILNKL